MKLYHGSRTTGIQVLEPRQADHGKPYVYLTDIEAIAAIYLCNGAEPPYYWFPYGFERESRIPVYHEIYPDALKDVAQGVKGYIYEVEAEENQLTDLKGIPCARLSRKPLKTVGCWEVLDAYELLQEFVRLGKLKVSHYEDKTEKQLDWWYNGLAEELKGLNMIEKQDCSYAVFMKTKLPQVWEKYLALLK